MVSIDCEGLLPPVAGLELALELPEAEPLALDWLDELVLEGKVELLLVDGEVPPVAALEPVAEPAPDDWLVCALWFMLEDGFVLVAFWLADVLPLVTL